MGRMNVAVIGLGSMGYGMAVSVLRAGHATWGVDINAAAMERFRAQGGEASAADEAAGNFDAVVVVVLNAAQTEAVLFGPDGVVPKLKPGAVVIACATVPPDFARAMEAVAPRQTCSISTRRSPVAPPRRPLASSQSWPPERPMPSLQRVRCSTPPPRPCSNWATLRAEARL